MWWSAFLPDEATLAASCSFALILVSKAFSFFFAEELGAVNECFIVPFWCFFPTVVEISQCSWLYQ